MYGQDNAFQYNAKEWNTGVDFGLSIPPKDPDTLVATIKDVKGHLAAWDPVQQKEVWPIQHDLSWNGGLLSTAGNLVFQGRADGHFAAYRADNGELVWESPVHVGIIAPPVTYTVDGEQYIAVVAGWGGAYALASGIPRHRSNVLTEGRILAFKLGGTETLPEPAVTYLEVPEPPAMETTPEQVAQGELLFHQYCSVCHGGGGLSSAGSVPDLRYSSAQTHEIWDGIVLGGAYTDRGMVKFDHVLDVAGSRAIQAYVVENARATIALCQSEYRKQYPEVLSSACVRASVTE